MKITKRQLRRIIREEKARLQGHLNEDVVSMSVLEGEVNSAAFAVATTFSGLMYKLKDEMGQDELRPGWNEAVDSAEKTLEQAIIDAVNAAINQVEAQLHDGSFNRGSR
ncbi:hypothetical protein OAA09_00945 [bacterium]|nr:hypothetical protein [bacterium]